MGNLTEFMPQVSKTVQAIYDHHKAKGDAEPQRGYLGASIIGEECERSLWYTFRGLVSEEIEGRLYRLFETGNLEEVRFVRELRAIGCEVVAECDGEELRFNALGGHYSGGMDSAILGVPEAPKAWHVGEFKTHKASSFAKLVKEGVRPSKPLHYAQMQAYMGGTGMKRALYLARNKDTDELYAERVNYDATFNATLLAKAERVIRSSQPPERIANRQDDWRCRFCDAYTLCWGLDREGVAPDAAVPIPSQTCRSCCHSTPITEGEGARWICEKFGAELADTDVGGDCPSHLLLPGLVGFAEPTDSGPDWIEFESRDGTIWRHGPDPGQWTTEALLAGPGPLVAGARPLPMAARSGPPSESSAEPVGPTSPPALAAAAGSAATGSASPSEDLPDFVAEPGPESLLDRYPWSSSERCWDGSPEDLFEAIPGFLGIEPEQLGGLEPQDHQVDDDVNAVSYRVPAGDFLIVVYKADGVAAIWKGRS